MKLMDFVCEEYCGKEHNGKSPVTLRLVIDKDSYDALKGICFSSAFPFLHV